ncbi:MAG: DUF4292 domain-containing protein [Flavipsychrobacter sp.]|nr:DUF4292 domain-containing protein [Flavipsychrobacter sp.]
MNRLLAGIVALMVFFSLPACKTGKQPKRKKVIVDSSAIVRVQDSMKAIQLNHEKQQLIESLTGLWQKQIRFNTFNAKVKAHFQSPDQKHEFAANIRIEKDKAIWAYITALGMVNVARIYITPDSFRMINYLEKKVTLMALKDADTLLPIPVDFQYLQNMLMGNVLKQSGTIIDATDFGGTWSFRAEDEEFIQQYSYNKADTTMRSAQLSSKGDAGTGGMIQLGNHEMHNGQRFSLSRAINMMSQGKAYFLDMTYNKVDFDQPVEFPFSVPRKFEVNGATPVDENGNRPGRRQQRRNR